MKSLLSISILLTCASAFANAPQAPAANVRLLPAVSLMLGGQVGPGRDDDARTAASLAPKVNLLPEGQVGPASDDDESGLSIFLLDPEGQVGPASDDD